MSPFDVEGLLQAPIFIAGRSCAGPIAVGKNLGEAGRRQTKSRVELGYIGSRIRIIECIYQSNRAPTAAEMPSAAGSGVTPRIAWANLIHATERSRGLSLSQTRTRHGRRGGTIRRPQYVIRMSKQTFVPRTLNAAIRHIDSVGDNIASITRPLGIPYAAGWRCGRGRALGRTI